MLLNKNLYFKQKSSRLLLFLFFLYSSVSVAENEIKDAKNVLNDQLFLVVSDKDLVRRAIDSLENADIPNSIRYNYMGVGYMLLGEEGFEYSEKLLKKSIELGSNVAKVNLAELYFANDLYEECLRVIATFSEGESPPYRGSVADLIGLKAQIMYLSASDESGKRAALDIFEQIEDDRVAGVSSYYRGSFLMDEGFYLEGIEQLKNASSQGITRASLTLGYVYYYSDWVARDLLLAELYYRRAADKDDPSAYYFLYTIYRDLNDNYMAKQFLTKAAALGDKDAKVLLSN